MKSTQKRTKENVLEDINNYQMELISIQKSCHYVGEITILDIRAAKDRAAKVRNKIRALKRELEEL